jgi:hypothetical protein
MDSVKRIGFTGTRYGMTEVQRASVIALVEEFEPVGIEGHHGDCIGADREFHYAVVLCGGRVVLHPPTNPDHRAYCMAHETRPEFPYMRRNKNIVDAVELMIAGPCEMREQERGGTWRTIQLARKAKRPLLIVWPDGRVTEERTVDAATLAALGGAP